MEGMCNSQVISVTQCCKNGTILRVAYAKSLYGSGTGISPSDSSNLAAAAIEAATFSQQYDGVGWAPKEYKPDENRTTGGQAPGVVEVEASQRGAPAPQFGFVWDESSGYYYDAASGFYYDGNSGLYYDSNSALWYSYDLQTEQYIPCPENSESKLTGKQPECAKIEKSSRQNVIISAATNPNIEKAASLPDAVQAAAAAAIASEKKEKERMMEIKLASKSSILASKKKMSNVLTMWKQRSHETQTHHPSLGDNPPTVPGELRSSSLGQSKDKVRSDAINAKERTSCSHGVAALQANTESSRSRTGGPLMGVIRGSSGVKLNSANLRASSSGNADMPPVLPSIKTDGYASSASVSGSGRRWFCEVPATVPSLREHPQTSYRDRAAERRNLYGSSANDIMNIAIDSNEDIMGSRKGALDPTPFPPGVGGGGHGIITSEVNNYDVITTERAIDESNVGNRMLRSMGWHEGSGLGKDGSGMKEPVQAHGVDRRAGLGSSQQKKVDNVEFEAQPGDTYKTLLHKKALARFRDMSDS